ncbi:hypothetical protein [Streptomyces sp. NPDC006134]|uniref:hypothetical protein n=1 Tax=Streptomyces sp. NPDC006134 TaxID=3154467 RepID=UPI00340778AB
MSTSHVPYATDGTDFRGALRFHYVTALKRFAKYFVIFAPLWPLVIVTNLGYLLPLALVGIVGSAFTMAFFWGRVLWIWKCSRVFRAYPLKFRGPVTKVAMDGHDLFLRFPGQGDKATMRARNPLMRSGWPEGIAKGVWFAGDDPFGGAAIVPGTGELLFMQPKEWGLFAEERGRAGAERIGRAKRGRIKRATRWRGIRIG